MPEIDPTEELNQAVEKVLASQSTKRLVVAGPGAGKTYLFKEILKRTSRHRISTSLASATVDLSEFWTRRVRCRTVQNLDIQFSTDFFFASS